MQRVEVTLPADLAERVEQHRDRLDELIRLGLEQLQIREAIDLYSDGKVSMSRAAELVGLSREAIVRHARALAIEPLWSEEMVREELA